MMHVEMIRLKAMGLQGTCSVAVGRGRQQLGRKQEVRPQGRGWRPWTIKRWRAAVLGTALSGVLQGGGKVAAPVRGGKWQWAQSLPEKWWRRGVSSAQQAAVFRLRPRGVNSDCIRRLKGGKWHLRLIQMSPRYVLFVTIVLILDVYGGWNL
jgi:hypothetical protein